MPEKVTREEKIIELAILKARETLEALRDGEITEPMEMEKVKRPKAKASKHGIKQDKVHANAGGEDFTSGRIKKAFDKKKMITAVRSARAAVLSMDREIERLVKKEEKSDEDKEKLKLLKVQVEALYKVLTDQMSMLSRSKGGFGYFKKFNEATDTSEDPRDTTFTEEGQRKLDDVLGAILDAMRENNSKLLTATGNEYAKLERELKELTSDLKALTLYSGRSS